MQILLAPKAGYCFGVKRAMEMAEKTITGAEASQRVSSLGPLIHNPAVVASLEARGVKAVGRPAEAGDGMLIVRSHGAPPAVIAEAKELGLTVIDATCPFVRKAQRLAAQLAKDGYQVVVIGDPEHPEIKGVVAAAGRALVLGGAEDIAGHRLRGRVGVICQTTLAPESLAEVVSRLAQTCRELLVHNTICTATFERQRSARELARQAEVMVVVGGFSSANTAHLAEVCRELAPTYQVEEARQIDPAWFQGCNLVGVTAGASTPPDQIEAVVTRLTEIAQEGRS